MVAENRFHSARGESVFVDDLRRRVPSQTWRWAASCHLYTLPGWEGSLHEFAAKIGLRRVWYQEHCTMPHYDLTPSRRIRAVQMGAVEVDRASLVDAIRAWRANSSRQVQEALALQWQEERTERAVLPLGEPDESAPLPDAEVERLFAEARRNLLQKS